MGIYTTIKSLINSNIKANGKKQITGPRLNTVLTSMVDSIVGQGYVFGGVATSSTTFGTPEQRTFWMAQEDFTHATLGSVKGGDIILWDGTTLTLKSMELSGGVFYACYNCVGKDDTTYSEISLALTQGKYVVLYRSDTEFLPLVTNDGGEGGEYAFSKTEGPGVRDISVNHEDVWTDNYTEEEEISNKKTELPTDTSHDSVWYAAVGLVRSVKTAIENTISAIQTALATLTGRVDNLSAVGGYLSTWNCIYGGAQTLPPVNPRPYKAGDYFRVGVGVVSGKAVTIEGRKYQPTDFAQNFSELGYLRLYQFFGAATSEGGNVKSAWFDANGTPVVGSIFYINPSAGTSTAKVTAVEDSTAYAPSGTAYNTASLPYTTNPVPTPVYKNDIFVYDGNRTWTHITLKSKDVVWGAIDGTLSDQTDLWATLNGKQDAISDLDTIRSGAALGATALQEVPNTYRASAAQDVIDATKITNPSGGTTGQVLTKTANGEEWAPPQGSDTTAEEVTAAALNDLYDQTLSATRKTVLKSDIINDLIHPAKDQPISAWIAAVLNSKFAEIELVAAAALNDLNQTKVFIDCVAPAWNGWSTYSIGDLRTHNGKLWKCDTAITTPEVQFDATKWHTITIVDEFNL